MRITGRYLGDAPHFALHLRVADFHGVVWALADTGASRTTLLDRDVEALRVPVELLEPVALPIIGIGGSVRTFVIRGAQLEFGSDAGPISLRQDLWVARHDLTLLPPEEAARILRLPSVLGRDVLNRWRLCCDYRSGTVELED